MIKITSHLYDINIKKESLDYVLSLGCFSRKSTYTFVSVSLLKLDRDISHKSLQDIFPEFSGHDNIYNDAFSKSSLCDEIAQ